jgi:hypothetical protein
MIVAGIDEAGYGPLLGPLVVGCCAFEIGGSAAIDPAQPAPCLWKRLTKLVSKNRTKTGRKLHVNDSKEVYSPSLGLKELERSILCVLAAAGKPCATFDEFLKCVSPDAAALLGQHPWYGTGEDERWPFEQEALPLTLFANALRMEMERTGTYCVHLRACVVPEKPFNRMIDQMRNKAGALFSISARHLDHLLRTYSDRPLVIHCDRQGGREHYAQLLRLMFEDWGLDVIRELDGHSEYLLHHPMAAGTSAGVPPVRVIFREKAESQSMAVALASMLSKYVREGLMRRFNRFWKNHLPEVAPTAGYYGDGARFLQDIEAKRRELGIPDELLIRSR